MNRDDLFESYITAHCRPEIADQSRLLSAQARPVKLSLLPVQSDRPTAINGKLQGQA